MVLGLRHFTERSANGAGPAVDIINGEELKLSQPNTAIVLDNRPPESPGVFYITTKKIAWFSGMYSEKGYAVDFSSVSLHAASTDPESYPLPCIYARIVTDADEDESQGSDSECDEPRDLSMVTEMRIVPSDPSLLTVLYDVFCECAELNPKPIVGGDGILRCFAEGRARTREGLSLDQRVAPVIEHFGSIFEHFRKACTEAKSTVAQLRAKDAEVAILKTHLHAAKQTVEVQKRKIREMTQEMDVVETKAQKLVDDESVHYTHKGFENFRIQATRRFPELDFSEMQYIFGLVPQPTGSPVDVVADLPSSH